ncbi:MAG: metallophosphoesterase [Elusimicrobia bacterium]|nr:metallophosphoesterase [Elusimicrobiota bacterium]
MKILFVTDNVSPIIYSEKIKERFGECDLVISCGDLPFNYYDFIVSTLNKPLYYIRGNHFTHNDEKQQKIFDPDGGKNIHKKIVRFNNISFCGFEGCLKYNNSDRIQYSEFDMNLTIQTMKPRFWWNRIRYGTFIDLIISHAPPKGFGTPNELCHKGFSSLRRLVEKYQPRYLVHGHIHIYDRNKSRISMLGKTKIINAYDHYVLDTEGK